MPDRTVGRAVVVGGSMAGLLTARVLCDHADEVVLVERDRLPAGVAQRRGVPQASHTHLLQPRGLQAIEQLFPGISAALQDRGAIRVDNLADVSVCLFGRLFTRRRRQRPAVLLSTRNLLEHHVRSRVRTLDRLHVRDESQVVGLVERDGRVVGVRLAGQPRAVDAELVVVASGRVGRLDTWLSELGRPTPRETRQPVEVRYTSQPLSLPDGTVPEHLVMVGPRPGRPTGFYLTRNEGGLRLCTAMGYGVAGPAPRREDLLATAAELAPPDVAEAVHRAEPLGPVTGYRFAASGRLRVGRTLPDGLVVVGDMLCSFNPIYGQGMTVAACQAVALGEALSAGLTEAARRYHLAADRIAGQAWDVSVPADRTVLGAPQSLRERVEQRYQSRLLDRATWDTEAAVDVIDVLTMSRPKQTLMRPGTVRRALRTVPPPAT